jgi:DNA helicase HerA-like ATPase
MFDRVGLSDSLVHVLLPEHEIATIPRNTFVRILSVHPRTGEAIGEYIGVVASGPFAEPDALHAADTTLVVTAAHGAVLTPKYHGIAHVDVFAQRVDGVLIPPDRRPAPNSPVFKLDDADVETVIGLRLTSDDGPCPLGILDGPVALPVSIPASRKAVLFKHAAVLGTTGGGKSTTIAGMMDRLAMQGNAVVVFDIEGEYTTLNHPADSPAMVAALKKRQLKPKGSDRTHVFVLSGRDCSNPVHPAIHKFKLSFSEMSPYVLVEILGLSEPQERRFIDAYEVCRMLMEQLKIFPVTEEEQQAALDVDELERGWPKMTLTMMLDVVGNAIEIANKNPDGYNPRSPEFRDAKAQIIELLKRRDVEKDARSWKAIAKRLWRMQRAKVFGDEPSQTIAASDLVQPGKISIVDLSDMDTPYLRNLVIAQVLRLLQVRQEDEYREQEARARRRLPTTGPTRVNIFIEEAHEFLSAQRIKQMPHVFDQLARVARRGRKRYLGLVFVTQLPAHLPDEVFGLVNNWVLHKLTDANVIQRLRKVVPMVNDSTWSALPNFAPGQALCAFTHLQRPIMVSVDPAQGRLRMVE